MAKEIGDRRGFEAGFGWHAEPPEWRDAMRKLYPEEYVQARWLGVLTNRCHLTEQMMREHRKRLRSFHEEFVRPRLEDGRRAWG